MIAYTPFQPGHLQVIRPVEWQLVEQEWPIDEHVAAMLATSLAITALRDGKPVACAGITDVPGWSGRATAWAMFSLDAGPCMASIVRKVRRAVAAHPARRIEAVCHERYKAGHHFLLMTGFVLETPRMRGYMPDGSDAAGYVRVKT
jgi:hypothetical protein